ncbi:MAG: DUF1272 domain-containing protein [Chitinophagia bacterium]|nr:DUF1272 domain-containing protein [Chitinophagia bacterium]
MLELRPVCENCGKGLPNHATDAMICTFECTFCRDCVTNILNNVCPNCGGGFEKRPSRPVHLLGKYPAKSHAHFKPINMALFLSMRDRYKSINPEKR